MVDKLILGLLLSIFVAFVMKAALVTKPLILGTLFSISVIFVLQSVFLTIQVVQPSSIFLSRPFLSESSYILVTNPLVLGNLVSIAFTLATNLSPTVFWLHHYPLHYLTYLNQQEQSSVYLQLIYLLELLDSFKLLCS